MINASEIESSDDESPDMDSVIYTAGLGRERGFFMLKPIDFDGFVKKFGGELELPCVMDGREFVVKAHFVDWSKPPYNGKVSCILIYPNGCLPPEFVCRGLKDMALQFHELNVNRVEVVNAIEAVGAPWLL